MLVTLYLSVLAFKCKFNGTIEIFTCVPWNKKKVGQRFKAIWLMVCYQQSYPV